jgi:glycosyltransferase involved in cell wall biosynthesis
MKIHIHTPSFFPTLVGMTYAAHVRASMLRALGAEVTVIAPMADRVHDTEAFDYEVRCFEARGNGLPWNPLRGELDAIVQFAERERPDITIVEGWFTTAAALLPRLRQASRHVVLASHGAADLKAERLHPMHIMRSLAYRWEERTRSPSLMRLMSAAIVLSAYEDCRRFRDIKRFRANGVPLFVCPNTSTYTPTRGHKLRADRCEIIHIGEMKPHKDPKCAVRTLAALPPHFHLTLTFPERTDYLPEVMALAHDLGVGERLSLMIGRSRSELELEMENSDILLITSPSKDVQPIVAVDALAKGVPFVSTDVGCMREFGGGIVAAPGELALGITTICRDERTYRRYSDEACAYHDRALSPSIAQNSLSKLLASLSR